MPDHTATSAPQVPRRGLTCRPCGEGPRPGVSRYYSSPWGGVRRVCHGVGREAVRGADPATTLQHMESGAGSQFSAGDVVTVPWELEELRGVVRDVNKELGRLTVELRIEGHPEVFNFPVSAVSLVAGDREEAARPENGPWAGGIDDNTVLKGVLEGVGAGRRVSVHLTPTKDEDHEPLLFIGVFLLDAGDQELSPDELLTIQTNVRDRVFEAIKEAAIVIVQVLPLEASAA